MRSRTGEITLFNGTQIALERFYQGEPCQGVGIAISPLNAELAGALMAVHIEKCMRLFGYADSKNVPAACLSPRLARIESLSTCFGLTEAMNPLQEWYEPLRGGPLLCTQGVCALPTKDTGEGELTYGFPKRVCMAEFSCNWPVIDDEGEDSVLTLVWYQDDLAFPIDPDRENWIKHINWNGWARDRTSWI